MKIAFYLEFDAEGDARLAGVRARNLFKTLAGSLHELVSNVNGISNPKITLVDPNESENP